MARRIYQFGQYDKALAAFHHVTELDPDNYLGHMNTGAIYFEQAKYDEAIAETQKAIELQPAADLYSNLGLALLYLKRYPDAIAALEKSAKMHPNDEQLWGTWLTDIAGLAKGKRPRLHTIRRYPWRSQTSE